VPTLCYCGPPHDPHPNGVVHVLYWYWAPRGDGPGRVRDVVCGERYVVHHWEGPVSDVTCPRCAEKLVHDALTRPE
jgi:hypothetical protein